MRWYVRHFYDVGIGCAIIALACGVLADLDTLQQILLLSFAVLCLHEFEEYGWPGGFPGFMNRVMFPKILGRLGKESGPSDRYILNQVNSTWVNVVAAYPLYVVPIFFPGLIWLGLAPILFNLMDAPRRPRDRRHEEPVQPRPGQLLALASPEHLVHRRGHQQRPRCWVGLGMGRGLPADLGHPRSAGRHFHPAVEP